MAITDTSALEQAIAHAVDTLKTQHVIPADWHAPIQLMRTKDASHGDFATNIAMMAAKPAKMNPRNLAQQIIQALPEQPDVTQIEIAGPGFINFFLAKDSKYAVIEQILTQTTDFGRSQSHAGERVQVEFVSANPTSSLHVGHGRGAAYGMSVANLLEAVGYDVEREYYVNDAGRQMDILAVSTYLRYLEITGATLKFPSNGYQGDYVKDIAQQLYDQHQDTYQHPIEALFSQVPEDAVYRKDNSNTSQCISGDKEKHIDGLIQNAKALLGESYSLFLDAALTHILEDIKADLREFGVTFTTWFSERRLQSDITDALEQLDKKGYLYQKEGNTWFRSTDFGDEKDRVVKRANGQTTYFAADIAYHRNKFLRGFDKIINVWGADHHGYMARVRAAMTALGFEDNKLDIILVQFVSLWRGDEQVQMSSRSGQFVTLRELRQEVGQDAARFYYVTRKSEQHIDFDLELAKSESKDNAVYYIQYAHARICQVFRKLTEQDLTYDSTAGQSAKQRLSLDAEDALITKLAAYPDTVSRAATTYEPHQITNYLKELAALFHAWYNENRIIGEDSELMQARLWLISGVQQVLVNGLSLLDISAPTSM